MADVNTIAEYIYRRARELGVDPNMALGIARYEGLNPNTLGSPTFGNRDAKGYSFGPYQLYSGSPDPSRIAPGGLAYEFQQQFGAAPSRDNWQQQVDFSLNKMRTSHNPWYAVRDQGGLGAITQKGRAFAEQIGLGGGVPVTAGSETRPPVGTNMPQPVQANNLGSYIAQRMGVKLPTPAPAAAAPTSPMGALGGLLSALGGSSQPAAPPAPTYENRPDPRKLQELFGGLLT